MSPDDPRHGTCAGGQAHRRAGEEVCGPCKEAARDAMRKHRETTDREPERRRTAARHRALWRLAALHRDEFDRLVRDEVRREFLLKVAP